MLLFLRCLLGHALWNLLDEESKRERDRNYLAWLGNVVLHDTIIIEHFGPLGDKRSKGNQRDDDRYTHAFANDMMQRFGVQSKDDYLKLSESNRKNLKENYYEHVRAKYVSVKESKSKLVEVLKSLLISVIEEVFGAMKTCVMITYTDPFIRAVGPTALKIATKNITTVVLKEIAKEIAKLSAKQAMQKGGKSAAKKVPLIGATIGTGLAIWRAGQGDFFGAGLEMTSGIASCFPGTGTFASLGIDVALAARDITGTISFYSERQRFIEHRSNELQKLSAELETLDYQFKIIKDAYKEFDYEDDNKSLINALNFFTIRI